MAYLSEQYCTHCKRVTSHCNNRCSPCGERLEKERTAKWNAFTADEKIEALRKRIESLEQRGSCY